MRYCDQYMSRYFKFQVASSAKVNIITTNLLSFVLIGSKKHSQGRVGSTDYSSFKSASFTITHVYRSCPNDVVCKPSAAPDYTAAWSEMDVTSRSAVGSAIASRRSGLHLIVSDLIFLFSIYFPLAVWSWRIVRATTRCNHSLN